MLACSLPWLVGCAPPAAPPEQPVAAVPPQVEVEQRAAPQTEQAARAPQPRMQAGVVPPIASQLYDGFESRLPLRAKLARGARLRANLQQAVPEAPAAVSDTLELVVLETAELPASTATGQASEDRSGQYGQHPVRVVVDNNMLRVALWADPQQLALVATQRVPFATSATSVPPTRGPVAYPGLRVRIERAARQRAEVRASHEFPSPDSGLVSLQGWLDVASLGRVYQPVPAESAVDGKPFYIDQETPIRSSPGGAIVAEVQKGGGGVFFPVVVTKRQRGHAQVFLRTTELELRGFVPDRVLVALEPETARGWGRAHFEASLWQRWPKEQVEVDAGTCIYDEPAGAVIGVFRRSHVENVVLEESAEDYRAYRLPYDAVAYVHARDVRRVEGGHQSKSKQTLELPEGAWRCPQR